MTARPRARFTLGRLVKATGLARSSLLHYESLGLLTPAARSAAGYRLYDDAGLERVRSIRRYREAGLSLGAIRELLGPGGTARGGVAPARLLESRLLALSDDIARLRRQQRQLATILALPAFRAGRRAMSKGAWTRMLREAGFSEEDMGRWHADFEREAPEDHAAFLASLGLSRSEVAGIRRASRRFGSARGTGPRGHEA